MTAMLAKKVRVSYVLGGTYDIAVDEHEVSTAHEKMRAVADGYRLHPAPEPDLKVLPQGFTISRVRWLDEVDPKGWSDGLHKYQVISQNRHGITYRVVRDPAAQAGKKKPHDELDAYRPGPLMRGVPAEWVARDA